jgi:hypothetical protein
LLLLTSHNGTYPYDNAGRLTNVSDTVATSGLGGTYSWNADGTLATMPGPGYRRVLSYDEGGRLTQIAKLQSSVTTPLFQYGYGYDGGRRWRKDLANNVWDWYPCGVACCAGDLVTLRSTDGGTTWANLERRLDRATVLDGVPFLANSTSGRLRIGAEAAVTDALGVRRVGVYGSGLNSVLNLYRGDAGVEETLRQTGTVFTLQRKETKRQDGIAQIRRCVRDYNQCIRNCNIAATACVSAAYTALLAAMIGCRLIPVRHLRTRCYALAGATFGAAYTLCLAHHESCLDGCFIEFEDCINEIN